VKRSSIDGMSTKKVKRMEQTCTVFKSFYSFFAKKRYVLTGNHVLKPTLSDKCYDEYVLLENDRLNQLLRMSSPLTRTVKTVSEVYDENEITLDNSPLRKHWNKMDIMEASLYRGDVVDLFTPKCHELVHELALNVLFMMLKNGKINKKAANAKTMCIMNLLIIFKAIYGNILEITGVSCSFQCNTKEILFDTVKTVIEQRQLDKKSILKNPSS